jgi:hypothetical protein
VTNLLRSLNRNVLLRERFDVSCRCPHCNVVGAHAVTNQRRSAYGLYRDLSCSTCSASFGDFMYIPLVSEITRPENRP